MKCKYIQTINIIFRFLMLAKQIENFSNVSFRLATAAFSTFYSKTKSNKFFIVYLQYHFSLHVTRTHVERLLERRQTNARLID